MRILIIQTAFIGDVILALPIAQKIKRCFPESSIHFLLRAGNEGLLDNHLAIDRVWIWEKRKDKLLNLYKLIKELRQQQFDKVINVHRFLSSGLITALVGARERVGFKNNPLSFLYTKKYPHIIGDKNSHNAPNEVVRNLSLVAEWTDRQLERPCVYPSEADRETVLKYKNEKYIVVAPCSVWQTKQYPIENWIKSLSLLEGKLMVYLIGSEGDREICETIGKGRLNYINFAGKLSLLQSAALMEGAVRVIANDSAPIHLASAVNAPTTAIFCSTIPQFGFGPMSDDSEVVEYEGELACRPCGIHGFKQCPEGHFKCGKNIDIQRVVDRLLNGSSNVG